MDDLLPLRKLGDLIMPLLQRVGNIIRTFGETISRFLGLYSGKLVGGKDPYGRDPFQKVIEMCQNTINPLIT